MSDDPKNPRDPRKAFNDNAKKELRPRHIPAKDRAPRGMPALMRAPSAPALVPGGSGLRPSPANRQAAFQANLEAAFKKGGPHLDPNKILKGGPDATKPAPKVDKDRKPKGKDGPEIDGPGR